MTIHTGRGRHLAGGQGEAIWFLDTLMTVKASGRVLGWGARTEPRPPGATAGFGT